MLQVESDDDCIPQLSRMLTDKYSQEVAEQFVTFIEEEEYDPETVKDDLCEEQSEIVNHLCAHNESMNKMELTKFLKSIDSQISNLCNNEDDNDNDEKEELIDYESEDCNSHSPSPPIPTQLLDADMTDLSPDVSNEPFGEYLFEANMDAEQVKSETEKVRVDLEDKCDYLLTNNNDQDMETVEKLITMLTICKTQNKPYYSWFIDLMDRYRIEFFNFKQNTTSGKLHSIELNPKTLCEHCQTFQVYLKELDIKNEKFVSNITNFTNDIPKIMAMSDRIAPFIDLDPTLKIQDVYYDYVAYINAIHQQIRTKLQEKTHTFPFHLDVLFIPFKVNNGDRDDDTANTTIDINTVCSELEDQCYEVCDEVYSKEMECDKTPRNKTFDNDRYNQILSLVDDVFTNDECEMIEQSRYCMIIDRTDECNDNIKFYNMTEDGDEIEFEDEDLQYFPHFMFSNSKRKLFQVTHNEDDDDELNWTIDTKHSHNICMSYHVIDENNIKVYWSVRGRKTRFLMKDLWQLWPRFFDETFHELDTDKIINKCEDQDLSDPDFKQFCGVMLVQDWDKLFDDYDTQSESNINNAEPSSEVEESKDNDDNVVADDDDDIQNGNGYVPGNITTPFEHDNIVEKDAQSMEMDDNAKSWECANIDDNDGKDDEKDQVTNYEADQEDFDENDMNVNEDLNEDDEKAITTETSMTKLITPDTNTNSNVNANTKQIPSQSPRNKLLEYVQTTSLADNYPIHLSNFAGILEQNWPDDGDDDIADSILEDLNEGEEAIIFDAFMGIDNCQTHCKQFIECLQDAIKKYDPSTFGKDNASEVVIHNNHDSNNDIYVHDNDIDDNNYGEMSENSAAFFKRVSSLKKSYIYCCNGTCGNMLGQYIMNVTVKAKWSNEDKMRVLSDYFCSYFYEARTLLIELLSQKSNKTNIDRELLTKLINKTLFVHSEMDKIEWVTLFEHVFFDNDDCNTELLFKLSNLTCLKRKTLLQELMDNRDDWYAMNIGKVLKGVIEMRTYLMNNNIDVLLTDEELIALYVFGCSELQDDIVIWFLDVVETTTVQSCKWRQLNTNLYNAVCKLMPYCCNHDIPDKLCCVVNNIGAHNLNVYCNRVTLWKEESTLKRKDEEVSTYKTIQLTSVNTNKLVIIPMKWIGLENKKNARFLILPFQVDDVTKLAESCDHIVIANDNYTTLPCIFNKR